MALLGANGAGKMTTLRAISNLVTPVEGEICFLGKKTNGIPPSKIVESGVAHVMEGRGIFPKMSVMDNLEMGAYSRKNNKEINESYDMVFSHFPVLKKRRRQLAGTLSGGEQQILAIGRGLMSKPKILLSDEASLGLAPLIIKEIVNIIIQLHKEEHVTILLVEQNAKMALNLANRAYVLETGKIVLEGKSEDLIKNYYVIKAYLRV